SAVSSAVVPFTINYANVSTLNFFGGSGGNTFTVHSPSATTVLNTGTGPDITNVETTTNPLTINGQGGNDNVILGNPAGGPTRSVQGIAATVTITNVGGAGNQTALTVDDSADTTPRTATISSPMPNSTTIHGLAPVDITASNLSMLTVDGGT